MYPYIRCCTCNNSLGEYIELYELLKNDLNKKELNKIYNGNYNPSQTEIDHINNIISSEILDFLKIVILHEFQKKINLNIIPLKDPLL